MRRLPTHSPLSFLGGFFLYKKSALPNMGNPTGQYYLGKINIPHIYWLSTKKP
nr:MAG TPA: hypothetical protein [Caudoviricetes sp.]